MAASNRSGFLPLLRCQHRVQRAASSTDDGVELGLNPAADRSQLTALPIHDGVDPFALLGGKPYLLGEAIAEGMIPRRTTRSVLETRPPELSRQKYMPIERDPTETTGQ